MARVPRGPEPEPDDKYRRQLRARLEHAARQRQLVQWRADQARSRPPGRSAAREQRLTQTPTLPQYDQMPGEEGSLRKLYAAIQRGATTVEKYGAAAQKSRYTPIVAQPAIAGARLAASAVKDPSEAAAQLFVGPATETLRSARGMVQLAKPLSQVGVVGGVPTFRPNPKLAGGLEKADADLKRRLDMIEAAYPPQTLAGGVARVGSTLADIAGQVAAGGAGLRAVGLGGSGAVGRILSNLAAAAPVNVGQGLEPETSLIAAPGMLPGQDPEKWLKRAEKAGLTGRIAAEFLVDLGLTSVIEGVQTGFRASKTALRPGQISRDLEAQKTQANEAYWNRDQPRAYDLVDERTPEAPAAPVSPEPVRPPETAPGPPTAQQAAQVGRPDQYRVDLENAARAVGAEVTDRPIRRPVTEAEQPRGLERRAPLGEGETAADRLRTRMGADFAERRVAERRAEVESARAVAAAGSEPIGGAMDTPEATRRIKADRAQETEAERTARYQAGDAAVGPGTERVAAVPADQQQSAITSRPVMVRGKTRYRGGNEKYARMDNTTLVARHDELLTQRGNTDEVTAELTARGVDMDGVMWRYTDKVMKDRALAAYDAKAAEKARSETGTLGTREVRVGVAEGGYGGTQMMTGLAGAGVGAAVGGAVDDENRLRGAAIGGVVGGLAGVGLGRQIENLGVGRQAASIATGERGALGATRPKRGRFKGKVKPEGSEVQLNRFGLDAAGQAKIDKAKAVLEKTEIPAVHISNAQRIEAAKRLGMKDVDEAIINKNLGGVTMLAIREVYGVNDAQLTNLYTKLRDAPLPDQGPIQNAIDALEGQNRALVKAFIPKASEFGRNLQSLQIDAARRFKDTPDALFFWEQKGSRAAGRQLLDAEVAEIRRLLGLGPAGREKLIKFMRDLNPPLKFLEHPWQVINQLRRAGLLTGLRTQARNFLSNTSEAVMRQADDAGSIVLDRIIERGLIPGMVASGRRSRVALSVGERITAGKLGAQKAFGPDGTIARTMRGDLDAGELRKLDIAASLNLENRFLDGYTKFMFRIQGAADQPARQFAFMESLLAQYKVVARQRGVPKARVSAWIETQLKGSLKELDATGVPDEFVIQAIIDSEEAVFQNRSVVGELLKGATGGLRRAVAGTGTPTRAFAAQQTLNLMEFVVPFRSTPSAVFGRLIERTPAGYLSTGAGLMRLHKAIKAGGDPAVLARMQRETTKTFGRATTGSVAMALGAIWAQQKLASGRWPDDQKEADKWIAEGKTEDAVFLNGRWRKLTGVSPLGNLIALGAQFYYDASNKDYQASGPVTAAASVAFGQALTAGRTIKEQSFLRGLNDLMQGLETRRGGKRQQQRLAASTGRSFVPIIVGDVAKLVDPVLRDARSFTEGAKVNIPILSRTVPVRLDELGRPKVLQQTTGERLGRFVDPFISQTPRTKGDRFLTEFKRVGFVPSRLSRHSGENDDEYRDRQMRVGAETRDALSLAFDNPRYRRLDTQTQAEALRRVVNAVRSKATKGRIPASWGGVVARQIDSAARP